MAKQGNKGKKSDSLRKRRLETGDEKWVIYYKNKHAEENRRRYNKYKDLPIDPNLIFFESFLGRCYADSPREIFEWILENPDYAGYHFVWSVNSPKNHDYLAKSSRVKVVKRLSDDYYEAFCTARYIINNITNNEFAVKKEGQTYIQTWHGTPLKRLGCDIEIEGGNGAKSREDLHEQYRRESGQFDYLLSPSPYASEKLASAFDIPVEERAERVIELGYPRNVPLFTTTEAEKKYLRHLYGIPEGKKVVLYCTTWRENNYKYGSGFEYELQLRQDKLFERFGDRACFLVRMHYNHRNTELDFAKYKGFLINGTFVEDVNRLFVIADALVTDYSSVMFDFANLKRPIVYYMYDRDMYENEIRGFYFDVSELPGPIVTNQDELEDALEKALFEKFVPDEKYKAFNAKFNCLDDAKATERVVDRLLPKLENPLPVPEILEQRRLAREAKAERRLEKTKKKFELQEGEEKKTKSIFRLAKKFYRSEYQSAAAMYARFYKRKRVDESTVLYESNYGKSMFGEVYKLFKNSLLQDGARFNHVWVVKDGETLKKWSEDWADYNNVSFVLRESKGYYKLLAEAKYLVTNEKFPALFSKKPEQVYINIWKNGNVNWYRSYMEWLEAEPERVTRELLKADIVGVANLDGAKELDKTFHLGNGFNGAFVAVSDLALREKEKLPEVRINRTDKTKLLIYCGKLGFNTQTSALMNLLDEMDYKRFDVTLFVEKWKLEDKHGFTNRLKNKVRVLYRTEMPAMTAVEVVAYRLRRKHNSEKSFSAAMDREWKRCFGDMTFDRIIDYSGFNYMNALLFASRRDVKKYVWAHYDMVEMAGRRRGRYVFDLYRNFDGVISSKTVKEINLRRLPEKVTTGVNFVTAEMPLVNGRGLRFSKEAIWLGIKPGLTEDGHKNFNFVTVSGFEPADRTEELVREFAKFHREYPNSWLYVLGSGPQYKYIVRLAKHLKIYEFVSLPGNVKNPYVVMKKSNCFIYPGHGENHKESISEARLFGLPILLSPSIYAKENMLENGQLMLEEGEDGIYRGMKAFAEGEFVSEYEYDVVKMNKNRMEEFCTAIQCGE